MILVKFNCIIYASVVLWLARSPLTRQTRVRSPTETKFENFLREYLFASFYLPTLLSFCFCFRLFSGVYNVKEIGGIGAFDFGFFICFFGFVILFMVLMRVFIILLFLSSSCGCISNMRSREWEEEEEDEQVMEGGKKNSRRSRK